MYSLKIRDLKKKYILLDHSPSKIMNCQIKINKTFSSQKTEKKIPNNNRLIIKHTCTHTRTHTQKDKSSTFINEKMLLLIIKNFSIKTIPSSNSAIV